VFPRLQRYDNIISSLIFAIFLLLPWTIKKAVTVLSTGGQYPLRPPACERALFSTRVRSCVRRRGIDKLRLRADTKCPRLTYP